jgi:hypothetical protein
MGDLWYFFHIFFALSVGKCNIQLKMWWKRDELWWHFSFCKGSRASHVVAAMRLVAVSTIFIYFLLPTLPGSIIPNVPMISDSYIIYIFQILFTAQIPSDFLTYLWKLAHNCGWSIPITLYNLMVVFRVANYKWLLKGITLNIHISANRNAVAPQAKRQIFGIPLELSWTLPLKNASWTSRSEEPRSHRPCASLGWVASSSSVVQKGHVQVCLGLASLFGVEHYMFFSLTLNKSID